MSVPRSVVALSVGEWEIQKRKADILLDLGRRGLLAFAVGIDLGLVERRVVRAEAAADAAAHIACKGRGNGNGRWP